MGALITNEPITLAIIECEDFGKVTLAFEATTAIPQGTQVKLNGAGTISPCAGPTDVPFGYVTTPARAAGDEATVSVYHTAKIRGLASANITLGQRVQITDFTTATRYAPAVSGNYAVGIALEAITAASEGSILLFNQPVLLP